MSAKPSRKLEVIVSGTRRYIDVQSGRASELHTYLRTNGVQSSPPEPAFTDVDSIELARDVDVKAVQVLLDDWS
jgi:hypothetical protein